MHARESALFMDQERGFGENSNDASVLLCCNDGRETQSRETCFGMQATIKYLARGTVGGNV